MTKNLRLDTTQAEDQKLAAAARKMELTLSQIEPQSKIKSPPNQILCQSAQETIKSLVAQAINQET